MHIIYIYVHVCLCYESVIVFKCLISVLHIDVLRALLVREVLSEMGIMKD